MIVIATKIVCLNSAIPLNARALGLGNNFGIILKNGLIIKNQ
jgi:hypothetical protein